jgi:hypothetical protein
MLGTNTIPIISKRYFQLSYLHTGSLGILEKIHVSI